MAVPINDNANGKLISKLATILGNVDKIQKKGHNTHFNYKFVREADLVEAVRDKLAKDKIFITSSVKKTEVVEMSKVTKNGEIVQYKAGFLYVEYTFRDGETGESFTVEGIGEIEQDGGKGIYKAITGAMKYMLMKNFLIDTGDDPEMDSTKQPKSASEIPNATYTDARTIKPAAKSFPATTAQKNCITRHWSELTKAEQSEIQEWMNSKGLKSETLTKRQASDVIDLMQSTKQKRQASARPVLPKGAPSPAQDPTPSAEMIESWAEEMRSVGSIYELTNTWHRIKSQPMQPHQMKHLQEVRSECIQVINKLPA